MHVLERKLEMLLRIDGKEECPVCDQRNELRGKYQGQGLVKAEQTYQ